MRVLAYFSRSCSHCGNKLEPVAQLTSSQFKELVAAYKESVMIRGNAFLSSTPAEMERFMDFMQRTTRVDVVIDALNVKSVGGMAASSSGKAKLLLAVVRQLKQAGLKTMVISRNHFKRYLDEVEKEAVCFHVQNKSQDDQFMIYAALTNGPKTFLLTNDELRNHVHLLPSGELRQNFLRWQRTQQITIEPFDAKSKTLKLKKPPTHGVYVQKDASGCWHVPFENNYMRASFRLPNSWLCIKHRG